MMSNHLDLHLLNLRPKTWQRNGFMAKHKLHTVKHQMLKALCA